MARQAGVRIALGSDFAAREQHGRNLEEIAWLADAGLPLEEALLSATVRGAELLGLGDDHGRIAPGCAFDAVVFDREPSAELFRAGHAPIAVFAGGKAVVAATPFGGPGCVRRAHGHAADHLYVVCRLTYNGGSVVDTEQDRQSRRSLLARGGAVAGAIGLAPLLGSAEAFAAGSASPRRGGELVIARSTEPTQFDPAASIVSGDVWTLDKLFEPLYIVDPKGKLTPWLATSYDVAKGGKQFTFHLRPGVKFSDGTPLTAADVKFSIDRARKAKGPLSFLDGPIVTIAAPDTHTVVFHLSAPWAPFVSDISAFTNSILPKNFGGKSEKAFFAKPVGTGPFMLDTFAKGKEVRLVANPHYWRAGRPYV